MSVVISVNPSKDEYQITTHIGLHWTNVDGKLYHLDWYLSYVSHMRLKWAVSGEEGPLDGLQDYFMTRELALEYITKLSIEAIGQVSPLLSLSTDYSPILELKSA